MVTICTIFFILYKLSNIPHRLFMYLCWFFGETAPSYFLKRQSILCSVDRASLYNLVNETNLVHSSFSVYFVNIIGLSGIQDGILHTRQPTIKKTSAKCHTKYSCSS